MNDRARDFAMPLETNAINRRLRAIAAMDVVGYSRLMESDEVGTHQRVNELFETIAKPAIEASRGRIVHRAGDGLLLEFESATDAVRCALSIQQASKLHERNAGDDRPRLELRVGINIGDIIFEGTQIAGDGVNIATRLESIAPPGGVLISGSVREQLHGDFAATIIDVGTVQLKNITRSVHVYRIVAEPLTGLQSVVARLSSTALSRIRGWLYVIMGISVVSALVFQMAVQHWQKDRTAPPMSLAVMPFRAVAGSSDQLAANSQAEQVLRGLASTSWINVIGPDRSSAASGDEAASLGDKLNVRYFLFGRVGRLGDRLSVDLQLVDASNGISAWSAHQLQRPGQSEADLGSSAVILLREAIYEAESKALINSGGKPKTPMEYKMIGDHVGEGDFVTLQSDLLARSFYEKGLALDPAFVPLLISVGYTLFTELELGADVTHEEIIRKIDTLSKRIVSNDPSSAPGWQYRAEALARQWRWDAALEASDKAIALDAGRALGFAHRARLMNLLGKPTEGLTYVDKALGLAEQRVGFALLERCRAQMALGRYEEAIGSCQKSVSTEEGWMQHAYLTSAYALLDDEENLKSERQALLRSFPELTISRIERIRYSNIKQYLAQVDANWYRGLRKAGIPEH